MNFAEFYLTETVDDRIFYHVTADLPLFKSGKPGPKNFKAEDYGKPGWFHFYDNLEDANWLLDSFKKEGKKNAAIVTVRIPPMVSIEPDPEALGRAYRTEKFQPEWILNESVEEPFHGITHYSVCGCTNRCRCKYGSHRERTLDEMCPMHKAGVK